MTNFGKGCCSADGKNEFSLPANGNFTLKCVFPDASQLFDAESVTQQDRPVLTVKRPFPLLETTFSFPCGRQHSPQCSAAVGALVLPLQSSPHSDLPLWLMSLLLDLSCSLNLFSAYFAAFLSFHQQGCSPAPSENCEKRTCEGCWKTPLVSFTCCPLPVQQTLLPLLFVTTCQSTTQIFLALYKPCMFYDIFLHPGCECCCSQSPRNTCDTHAQQLTPFWKNPW